MNVINKFKGFVLQKLSKLQKEQTFEECHYNKSYCDGVRHGIKLSRKAVQDMSFADLISTGDKTVVKVNIRDNELFYDRDFPDGVLCTYYLIDPDRDKLELLKTKIETRFDSGDEGFIDDIWNKVDDFVNANFNVLNISEEFEIAY